MNDRQPRPTLDEVEAQLAAQKRRRDIARMGAFSMHAQYDGRAIAAKTMAGRLRRYELQIDPTGELKARDPQALAKRVEAAMAADMAKVRLARTEKRARVAEAKARERVQVEAARTVAREAIAEKIRRTPPDDLTELATLVLAFQATNEQPF